MARKANLILPALVLLSTPARADDAGSVFPDVFQYPLQIVLFAFATVITAYFASLAFDAPPLNFDGEPMLPRYMTQKRLYYSGLVAYVVICAAAYDVFAFFFKDLLPFSEMFAPPTLGQLLHQFVQNGALTFPVVVVLATALFVALLKMDWEWNPLLVLRRLVWSWVSIPQLANTIMLIARDGLVVPLNSRREVANDPDSPYVDVGDFEKDRSSLDRRWAELCYIRLWLNKHRAEGIHYTFFNEPSLAWEKLEGEYELTCLKIAPLKIASPAIGRSASNNVADDVKSLRKQYCRLLACFIVFKNDTKKKAVSESRALGIPIDEYYSRSNPLRYLLLFLTAIIVAIYVGVLCSAVSWDVLHRSAASAFYQDPDLFVKWTCYGLVNYGLPILAVLMLTYFGWALNHDQPSSYPMSYARIFAVALVVSAVSLTCAVKIGGETAAAKPFNQLLIAEVKWSLAPALVALYVAHQVNRQIDPSLPDVTPYQTFEQLIWRLAKCVVFGLVVTCFSLEPTLSIPNSIQTEWPIDKLRVVILGTIFTIGFTIVLVGEFLIVKTKANALAAAPA